MVTALLLMIPVVLALLVQASFILVRRLPDHPGATTRVDVVDADVIADPG
jgi:hypothetical protein